MHAAAVNGVPPSALELVRDHDRAACFFIVI
jgi:hypothetical protein